jgi:hypothetical protein
MAGLTLRFERDDDGEVRLSAALAVGGFAGASDYWCPPSEFSDLIDDLAVYPIHPAEPIKGEWAGGIKLLITPVDLIGTLEVTASIIEFSDERTRCDAVFRSHYADLAVFRTGLLKVGFDGMGEAILAAS